MSLKSWFRKFKLKIGFKFVKNWLAEILDRTKAKNPYIFSALATVLTILHFGLEPILQTALSTSVDPVMVAQILEALPDGFLSLEWIFEHFSVPENFANPISKAVTWTGAIVLGSSTTRYLMSESRKEKRIAKSKAISEKEKSKKAA